METKTKKPFLREYQMAAVKRMFSGCILNGGVGSGKSRTGLFYYFKDDSDYRQGWRNSKFFDELKNSGKTEHDLIDPDK